MATAKLETKKEDIKTCKLFVPYNDMNDRERVIFFQGKRAKEKEVKEKLGLFIPKKQN